MQLSENLITTIKILGFIALVINIAYVYYLIFRRKDMTVSEFFGASFFSKPIAIFIIELFFVLGILLSDPVYSRFENTNIGSFFEKESYRECYYVYIRPDDKYQKAYRVEADIIKGSYGYYDYNDEGHEIYVSLGNGYFLEKIYWDNGGYLTFLDEGDYPTIVDHARLYPGKETRVTDKYEETYYVTLTSEKVKRIAK